MSKVSSFVILDTKEHFSQNEVKNEHPRNKKEYDQIFEDKRSRRA